MKILVYLFALFPLAAAWGVDRDLSSSAHVPAIGVASVCVALCDALFGQIISNTKWIPFCACYTPAEAQNLAEKFRGYHHSLFWSWIVAKITSACAITISAVLALCNCPQIIQAYRGIIIASGYLLFGIAVLETVRFCVTYHWADKTADDAKLKEMNYMYQKEQEKKSNTLV